jgi:hypothetical protein
VGVATFFISVSITENKPVSTYNNVITLSTFT